MILMSSLYISGDLKQVSEIRSVDKNPYLTWSVSMEPTTEYAQTWEGPKLRPRRRDASLAAFVCRGVAGHIARGPTESAQSETTEANAWITRVN
jgi:hypothetical protein